MFGAFFYATNKGKFLKKTDMLVMMTRTVLKT